MTGIEAVPYVAAFFCIWFFVAWIAKNIDIIVRRFSNKKLFCDDYWTPPKSTSMTHCNKCKAILIDRDYCRKCGEVNI